jgi:hypothetical protein
VGLFLHKGAMLPTPTKHFVFHPGFTLANTLKSEEFPKECTSRMLISIVLCFSSVTLLVKSIAKKINSS